MHTTYLEAKRAVDDRAISRTVWNNLFDRVMALPGPVQGPGPERGPGPKLGESPDTTRALRVVELGAGSGTMIDRLCEWGVLERIAGRFDLRYDAVERNGETAELLRRRLRGISALAAGEVRVGDFTTAPVDDPYDLVIAHAVIDLFPPDELPSILDRFMHPGSLLYAPIVFDGVTVFEPAIDPPLDDAILLLYHRSMSGGFARRHIVGLAEAGFSVLEAASSDWVVLPRPGKPVPDEVVLISTVLDMIERSVGAMIAAGESDDLVAADLRRWISRRREQTAAGELFFAAHHYDLVVER